MGANKYQLPGQWSEERLVERGLNKSHFSSVLCCWLEGVGGDEEVVVTSSQGGEPVAADAGHQVERKRWQEPIWPHKDGSSALIQCMIHQKLTWPRTGKEFPYHNFSSPYGSCSISALMPKLVALQGLVGSQWHYQHYKSQHWNAVLTYLDFSYIL